MNPAVAFCLGVSACAFILGIFGYFHAGRTFDTAYDLGLRHGTMQGKGVARVALSLRRMNTDGACRECGCQNAVHKDDVCFGCAADCWAIAEAKASHYVGAGNDLRGSATSPPSAASGSESGKD